MSVEVEASLVELQKKSRRCRSTANWTILLCVLCALPFSYGIAKTRWSYIVLAGLPFLCGIGIIIWLEKKEERLNKQLEEMEKTLQLLNARRRNNEPSIH